MQKPRQKPARPYFSSGPTCKVPGWSLEKLSGALVGRSHRSAAGIEALQDFLARSKKLLGIPPAYKVALVPGSATGAVESALWNFLGTRPVEALAFDVFGSRWQDVLRDELKVPGQKFWGGAQSDLPPLESLNFDHDVLFTWNGSTGGLRLPGGEVGAPWIPAARQGLTLCDATSAVFAMPLPWKKLDVTAFSWQKGLGGEAAHGMLVLSPRALAHLQEKEACWPTPFLFCLRREGALNAPLFEGVTLNTPSLLCLEDARFALRWAESIGGLPALVQRTKDNADLVLAWCAQRDWITPLRPDPVTRSPATLCLSLPQQASLPEQALWESLKKMRDILEAEGAGYDFLNHAKAQPCLRLWCGPTVNSEDLQAFLPWLEYAYQAVFTAS